MVMAIDCSPAANRIVYLGEDDLEDLRQVILRRVDDVVLSGGRHAEVPILHIQYLPDVGSINGRHFPVLVHLKRKIR